MPNSTQAARRQKGPLARVIYNPSSGNSSQGEEDLNRVIASLRALGIEPDVFRVRHHSPISFVANNAAHSGYKYVLACGGDNTVDLVARGLVGTRSTLVVIPMGTRNNIARALNIPADPAGAVGVIANGTRTQLDVGRARLAGKDVNFIELAAVGLTAAIFPAMDEAQKGHLDRIGDLLATFIAHPPAHFRLNLDTGKQKLEVDALTLVVLNMPYIGANFQIASNVDFHDRLLDVFIYADLGKLDLLSHALQVAQGFTDDPRVKHVRVKRIEIATEPPLPVMLDGRVLPPNILRNRTLRFETSPGKLYAMMGQAETLAQDAPVSSADHA